MTHETKILKCHHFQLTIYEKNKKGPSFHEHKKISNKYPSFSLLQEKNKK